MTPKLRNPVLALAIALSLPAAAAPLADWPTVRSSIASDAALEQRVREIVGKMTLAQKVGQMTQPEIKSATPDDVKRYYLGSVLNGGGSWPNTLLWPWTASVPHTTGTLTAMSVAMEASW